MAHFHLRLWNVAFLIRTNSIWTSTILCVSSHGLKIETCNYYLRQTWVVILCTSVNQNIHMPNYRIITIICMKFSLSNIWLNFTYLYSCFTKVLCRNRKQILDITTNSPALQGSGSSFHTLCSQWPGLHSAANKQTFQGTKPEDANYKPTMGKKISAVNTKSCISL